MIEIPLLAIITSMMTIGVRLSGLMLFAPFLGSAIIPPRVKAIFVFVLTLLLMPTVGHQIDPHGVSNWPLLVFTEFLIGVGMGIAANLVFDAVQLTGQIVGIQMGYSLVNILDPQTQVDTAVVAIFYQSIVLLLFLEMDVHYWLLRAIGDSFLYLPPGSMHVSGMFTMAVIKTVGEVFGVGIQIAAPVLSATLAADIVLGMVGKASPQLPLLILGPSIKSILGLLILMGTIKYWPILFHRLFLDSMTNSVRILHLAR